MISLARGVCLIVALSLISVTPIDAAVTSKAGPKRAKEIAGLVISRDGQFLAGAKVKITKVTVDNTPGKHPDVGKEAITGDNGAFNIPLDNPGAVYVVTIQREGYLARTVNFVSYSGANSPMRVRLMTEQDRITSGQVLRPDGTPAAGATLKVVHSQVADAVTHMGAHIVDPVANIDAQGQFTITSDVLLSQLQVSVLVPGTAGPMTFNVKPSHKAQVLRTLNGSSITGRVLRKAKPVANQRVCLYLLPTAHDHEATANEVVTDEQGRYRFEHLPPQRDVRIYVPMNALGGDNLASTVREGHTGPDGQTTEVAELNLHAAHHIRGRLVFSGRDTAAPEVTAVVERLGVVDQQTVPVAENGTFEIKAIPRESIGLSFHVPGRHSVPGYRLSTKNLSVDPQYPGVMLGRVDEDVNLTVLFLPGTGGDYTPGLLRHRRTTRVVNNGRVAIQVQGGAIAQAQGQLVRREVRDWMNGPKQSAPEMYPLAGVADESPDALRKPEVAPPRGPGEELEFYVPLRR